MTLHPIGCIHPACGLAAHSRGLCHAHYRQALAAVRSGSTTWPALEAAGRCRAADPERLRMYHAGRGLRT